MGLTRFCGRSEGTAPTLHPRRSARDHLRRIRCRPNWNGLDGIPETADDNTVKPNDNSGWIVQVISCVEEPQDMTRYVICVNNAS